MVLGALGRGRRCLLAAAACGLALSVPARAQQPAPDPTELDPSAPLDPMPDLGVEWPDMDAPDPVPEPEPGETAETSAEDDAGGEAIEDATAARAYAWRIAGLEPIADAEAILERFREQSTLEKEDGDPANAAQI
ncbi:MAG TPA: hypothetical protein VJ763_03880, partial [Sphingomicrobium sp.]|nr:hypothetical protein [Sphingomicrobium sp.]